MQAAHTQFRVIFFRGTMHTSPPIRAQCPVAKDAALRHSTRFGARLAYLLTPTVEVNRCFSRNRLDLLRCEPQVLLASSNCVSRHPVGSTRSPARSFCHGDRGVITNPSMMA